MAIFLSTFWLLLGWLVLGWLRQDHDVVMPPESDLGKTYITEYYWDRDGTLQTSEFWTEVYQLLPRDEYLQMPEVQRELELTDGQLADIKQLQQETRIANTKLERTFTVGQEELLRQEKQALVKEAGEKLNAIFIPEQVERFVEIAERLEMRQKGVLKYLKENADDWKLQVSEQQWKELESEITAFAASEFPKLNDFCKETFQVLYDPLNAKQRERLEQELGRQPDVEVFAELRLAQLRYTLQIQDSYSEQDKKQAKQLDYFANAPTFVSNPNGRIEVKQRSQNPNMFWLSEHGNFIANATVDTFPLPEDDLAMLKQRYEKFRQDRFSAQADWQTRMQDAPLDQRREWHAMQAKAMDDLLDSWVADFFRKLSPVGRQVFLDYYHQRSQLNYGIVATLVFGPLGERLELSEKQKDQILGQIDGVIESIDQECQRVEDRLFRTVYDVLGKKNARLIKQRLGERPKHVHPNLMVLTRISKW